MRSNNYMHIEWDEKLCQSGDPTINDDRLMKSISSKHVAKGWRLDLQEIQFIRMCFAFCMIK